MTTYTITQEQLDAAVELLVTALHLVPQGESELFKDTNNAIHMLRNLQPAKPLTNDELWTVWDNYYTDVASYDRQSFDVAFLRAVLAAAHNIGVKP